MKDLFVYSSFCIVWTLGCDQSSTTTELVQDELRSDIGPIQPNQVMPVCFDVANDGIDSWQISCIGVSCGCLTIDPKEYSVPPKSSVRITGTVVGGEAAGPFDVEAKFLIKSNSVDTGIPVRATVHGVVAKTLVAAQASARLRISPTQRFSQLSLNVVTAGSKKAGDLVAIESPAWLGVADFRHSAQVPCPCSDYEEIRRWNFALVLDGHKVVRAAPQKGSLVIGFTDQGNHEVATVEILAVDSCEIAVAPATVVWTKHETTREAKFSIAVTGLNPQELQSLELDVEPSSSSLRCDVIASGKPGRFRLVVDQAVGLPEKSSLEGGESLIITASLFGQPVASTAANILSN